MVLLALVAQAPGASGTRVEVTPIQKVLQLLTQLEAKTLADGNEAQALYDKYSEWCEDRSKELGYSIKTGKSNAADLNAIISKANADIASYQAKIQTLSGSIAEDEGELKAATIVRKKERSSFEAESAELESTIDMLKRSIVILEREMQKGASMLQLRGANTLEKVLKTLVQATGFSGADADRLSALVQTRSSEGEDDSEMGAPDADVYENQSGGIVETLESLLEKAEGQLDDTRKKETNAAHNYDLKKQALDDEIKYANQDLDDAKRKLAASGEAKATAEGELAVTTKNIKADQDTLKELHHDCMTKATDFEDETKSRGAEMKAIGEAKKILTDQFKSFMQVKATDSDDDSDSVSSSDDDTSFLQVRAKTMTHEAALPHVVKFVRALARKLRVSALAQLASQMNSAMRLSAAGGDDPFAKVKGLISDMIAKLNAEAEAEATHKAYCDKEMAYANEKKEDKVEEIEKLTTKLDKAQAKSAKLKEEIAVIQKELAELARSQAEMDKLRAQENDEFKKNKKDLEDGLRAVKGALKVLRDYYALDEDKEKDHEAGEGAAASIIGLLEVIESDFSKNLAEAIAEEEAAQADYDKETKENEVENASKSQDVKYKTQETVALDKASSEMTGDRESVQVELDAVLEYLSKLEEECIAKPEAYEERKRRREAEIAGLKEALEILEGEAALIQRK